jgi:hypothetical protein
MHEPKIESPSSMKKEGGGESRPKKGREREGGDPTD